MEKTEQIQILLNELNCAKGLKDLSSISTGSFYKEKDEIINQVTEIAREAIQYQQMIISCLNWIWLSDYTFDDFINHMVDECERTNQPDEDRVARRKQLNEMAELMVSI